MPTAPPDLAETTVRYLFAAGRLPLSDGEHLVAVPGGATTALDLDNRGPWKTVCDL